MSMGVLPHTHRSFVHAHVAERRPIWLCVPSFLVASRHLCKLGHGRVSCSDVRHVDQHMWLTIVGMQLAVVYSGAGGWWDSALCAISSLGLAP